MSYESRIRTQAIKGTPYHTGVPGPFADLMVAQSKHETGDYTSSFFANYNNAFGYSYYAGSNYQTGGGPLADNGAPIAVFPSVEASVMEMVDWIQRRVDAGEFPPLATITTPEQYAALLKHENYYGDTLSNYLAGLKRWFTPLAVGGGLGVVVVIAALFIFRKDIF